MMRHMSERFDVADIAGGISDALAKEGSRIPVNQALDRGGIVALRKLHSDPECGQKVSEQTMSGAVQLRHRNNVVSEAGKVEYRIMQRGLASAHAESSDSFFQSGDAMLEDGSGWIADTAITVSLHFQIEQSGAVLGGVESVRDRLIDWDGDGLRCRFNLIPGVDGNCFIAHVTPLLVLIAASKRRRPRRYPGKALP